MVHGRFLISPAESRERFLPNKQNWHECHKTARVTVGLGVRKGSGALSEKKSSGDWVGSSRRGGMPGGDTMGCVRPASQALWLGRKEERKVCVGRSVWSWTVEEGLRGSEVGGKGLNWEKGMRKRENGELESRHCSAKRRSGCNFGWIEMLVLYQYVFCHLSLCASSGNWVCWAYSQLLGKIIWGFHVQGFIRFAGVWCQAAPTKCTWGASVLCMARSTLPNRHWGCTINVKTGRIAPDGKYSVSYLWMQHLCLAFIKFRLVFCMFVTTPCFLLGNSLQRVQHPPLSWLSSPHPSKHHLNPSWKGLVSPVE